MKSILNLILIFALVGKSLQESYCDKIRIGTTMKGNDIVDRGSLNLKFDKSKQLETNLYYLPFEKSQVTFFITSPKPFTSIPVLESSDSKLQVYSDLRQVSMKDANELELEFIQTYHCPDENFNGIPIINTTFRFEQCPSITVSWQKSCGKDSIRKILQLNL